MKLDALRVDGFRGLRTARVTFDETTVLVGENDCGKSSLLEALDIALRPAPDGGPPRFVASQFHRGALAAGPDAHGAIRIALEFRERRVGEWAPLAASPLAPLLGASEGARGISLEIVADRRAGEDRVAAEWRLRTLGAADGGPELRDGPALEFLRRMNPLVRLRPGAIGAPAAAPDDATRHADLAPETARLVERIARSHATVVAGSAADPQAAIDEGFDAARSFIATAAQHFGAQAHPFRQMVAEILGPAHEASSHRRTRAPELDGAGGERIGVLAIVAALLRALPGALPDGAEPLLVIEDPEAHLHPMTLAAVVALIGDVRWQKVLTTQSGDVLAAEPLLALRRLTRADGALREWRVRPRGLSTEDLRRVGYHLRTRRGVATFARCWLLVEGETEFWLLPELARVAGHDFAREGIACVEFAQCGLGPLVRLAQELGIEWHVLADGDRAGKQYIEQARGLLRGGAEGDRLTALRAPDIEHCFHEHGYAAVFRRISRIADPAAPPRRVITKAIERTSKPMLALELVHAASKRGARGVPAPLARTIETCARLARGAG